MLEDEQSWPSTPSGVKTANISDDIEVKFEDVDMNVTVVHYGFRDTLI